MNQDPRTQGDPILLFAGDGYYPGGGWRDFVGAFPTAQAAMDACPPDGNDWAHVVIDGVIAWEYDGCEWVACDVPPFAGSSRIEVLDLPPQPPPNNPQVIERGGRVRFATRDAPQNGK